MQPQAHNGPMSTDAAADPTTFTLPGHAGDLVGSAWTTTDPRWVAVIAHGYGEHVGRYAWTAAQLNAAGASVYAADHEGHGRSAGERVTITDFEPVVADLDAVVDMAAAQNPGVPIVLIGHSMGGMIAARYSQLHADRLAAVILSGPVLGRWDTVEELLAMDEIPPTPIDPTTLSRDEAVGRSYEQDPLVWHGDFRRDTLQALHDEMETITEAGSVGDLPLLHLHGADDQLVPIGPSQEGMTHLQGSRTSAKTYPGARHEILNETNRDEVVQDMLAFVEGVLGRG